MSSLWGYRIIANTFARLRFNIIVPFLTAIEIINLAQSSAKLRIDRQKIRIIYANEKFCL
ncbi:MAG: hypothetical protein AAFR63_07880 [Cyanobacteria bacterium J06631_6]